ncbi:hypothetical protein L596_028589 [Steinernema carpocapsae]|uniref:Uncharacterized protein n=1 Tax=Steinernema carpocapsae TaxID=34508 RepID=A0A4V5ZXX6_STECR|nr:hypothetical protein L596_028589 [Steinernema carpocapsae]
MSLKTLFALVFLLVVLATFQVQARPEFNATEALELLQVEQEPAALDSSPTSIATRSATRETAGCPMVQAAATSADAPDAANLPFRT